MLQERKINWAFIMDLQRLMAVMENTHCYQQVLLQMLVGKQQIEEELWLLYLVVKAT